MSQYSFLEFPWLFLNVYSSRWTLQLFFKVSRKILLGFSLKSHLIYKLIGGGGELASSQFWVLEENEWDMISQLFKPLFACPSVCMCVCVYLKQILPVSCKVYFWILYRVLLVLWLTIWFLDICLNKLPSGIGYKLGARLLF